MSIPGTLSFDMLGIPKNSEWGPLLWQMLHGCAEKLGRTNNNLIFLDQRREMIQVLRYVEMIMPCQLCRNHYKDWRTRRPIDKSPETQPEFREAIRSWLYDLHEEINRSHNIVSGLVLENLTEKYGNIDLKEKGKEFFTLMTRAIALKAVDREIMKKFNTHYTFLSRIL